MHQSPQVPVEDDGFFVLQCPPGCFRYAGIPRMVFLFCGPSLGTLLEKYGNLPDKLSASISI